MTEKTALIRRCDICGTVNAVDLDATLDRWREMQRPYCTVTRATEAEAMAAWETAAKCDHDDLLKKLIHKALTP